jgi:lambda repressor-like predicted transcriptional regulator
MGHDSTSLKHLKEAYAVNWSALARRMGVHPSLISHTLYGRKRNKRARNAIAAAFGLKPEQIWPEEKAS